MDAALATQTARSQLYRDSTSRWWAGVLAAFGVLFGGYAYSQVPGQPFPLGDFKTFDGRVLTAEQLKGRPVLVYYWASWCPVCVSEMPRLKRTYSKYKDKGFEILAINFREDPVKARDFYTRGGYEFPGGPVDDRYSQAVPGLHSTPTWVLVDKQGIVKLKVTGGFEIQWQLEKNLESIL